MSNDVGANRNGTPRASHLSPSSAVASPTWGRPRSPLPPHRLAKLANALGVSTPMPAVHQTTSFKSRSFSDTHSPLDNFRRSPTPSTPASNFSSYAPSISKFLLHVIPPLHLPHEFDDDTDVTPPPPSASGYHTQFRRGTLVPMHASFQSQLGAIAKEYALPSTAGLILYLVSSAKAPHERSLTPSVEVHSIDSSDEPGPRLSEDIWKHLWTRVIRVEQRDDQLLLPSPVSSSPGMFGLSAGAQSTPFLAHESNGQPLRPFISTNGMERGHPQPSTYSFTPSPSTLSSGSDQRSNTKSTPPSSSSVSQSEPETPDTSSGSHEFHNDPATRANSLDLPGLHSSSIIPILAKVEFDIDRRKATWYDPWLRSRRMNHAKRTESRLGRKITSNEDGEQSDASSEKHRPLSLLIGRKETASPASFLASSTNDQSPDSDKEPESILVPVPTSTGDDLEPESNGYEELPEPQEDDNWSDDEGSDEDEFEDEFTARVTSVTGSQDPLADVFGNDADTWAGMQASSDRRSKLHMDPNIVDLSLTGADLTRLPSPTQSEFEYLGKEEDEVQALLDKMMRPQLSVSIPLSPEKQPSLPLGRKNIPHPLVLIPGGGQSDLVVPNDASPLPSSAGSTSLAYLNESSPDGVSANQERPEEPEDDGDSEPDYPRVRSPAESEKRGGAVFDDLDLGLDPTEDYDDNDPHDRRRSQYLMRAQLDEIERTMAQLSPRILHLDLEEEQTTFTSTLSPNNSVTLSPGMTNGEYYPPSPRLPQHQEPESNDPHRDSSDSKRAAWPAVPFSSLGDHGLTSPPLRPDGPPSPPRLAVNGITTSAPRSYMPNQRTSTTEISAETEKRRRELEEEQGYPAATPSVGRGSANPSDSPIIPLSPDPFGRYSSTPEPPPGSHQSSAYWDNPPKSPLSFDNGSGSAAPRDMHDRSRSHSSATSRFSADSLTGEELLTKPTNRSTLITVNTIKKFWRKSNKSSSSSAPPPTPTASGRSSTQLQRPERPSEDEGAPKTPIMGRFSPQPAPPRPSQEQMTAQPQQLSVPQTQQLGIPQQLQQPPIPFNGRPNAGPIVAAQMQPGRGGSTLDRLHFDQESPYPTRRAPYPSRPSSPSAQAPTGSQTPNPSAPSSLAPEKEKPSVRKSILKSWKSATGSISHPAPPLPEPRTSIEPRASTERPNAPATRGRRPSVLNFGSTRGSGSPDIPASPPIPHQYLDQKNERRQSTSTKSRLTSSSMESSHSPPQGNQTLQTRSSSPQRSMTSSRDSQETRPSFDVSQFEIVSPKMNSTLSYPYHGLDHD